MKSTKNKIPNKSSKRRTKVNVTDPDTLILTKLQCIKLITLMEDNNADAFSFAMSRAAYILNEICAYDCITVKDASVEIN